MRRMGLEPLAPYPGATKPWRCRCINCGEEVHPRYNNVASGQGGCSNCAHGFSEIAPSIVYLICHELYQAVKVGIGNVGNDRVGWHERNGWELLALRSTDTGSDARAIEQRVLKAWQTAGYPAAVDSSDMPGSGHTETAVDRAETRELALGLIDRFRTASNDHSARW